MSAEVLPYGDDKILTIKKQYYILNIVDIYLHVASLYSGGPYLQLSI